MAPFARRTVLVVLGLGVVALAVGYAARAEAVEQPRYEVLSARGGWEVRTYAPMVQAQVTVTGPFRTAVSDGFRVLAGYIFGGNTAARSIAMTAPVTARPADGQRIAMTSPVRASADGPDEWTVAFTMPSSWTLATLPEPNDPRVKLVAVEERRFAVRRFGGWATADRVSRNEDDLVADLARAGIVPGGPPVVAQYNPPWTPPPFRRNEILVPLP